MNARSVRIADYAEVLPGCAFKAHAKHEPEGSHQVILGKHLPTPGTGYRYHPEHELRITPRGKVERYSVKAGDVLFVSRGIRNQAVLVESVPEKTIASATFYLLRIRDDVDPAYLAWSLNQVPIQNRIRQIRTGAGTPIVQRKVFVDITIPLPSYQDQRRIAKLGACMVKEGILRQAILDRTTQLHSLLGRKLLHDLT
uniref:Type I restriction modification DNA specificity domain-containing protein n=1 Tax=Candidatus Kentrum sp. FW TaxID=2126338 RepID=A0A450S483_9GAMM|nr:MAG: Type I restriction modification DNA specificity domain-containing protein [Candidatus Kentron sp. FW]VFJ47853.1 MAG: Type I restriction modification DNA specificity domain-containing protein [Candidatus Kentron sp. FW]